MVKKKLTAAFLLILLLAIVSGLSLHSIRHSDNALPASYNQDQGTFTDDKSFLPLSTPIENEAVELLTEKIHNTQYQCADMPSTHVLSTNKIEMVKVAILKALLNGDKKPDKEGFLKDMDQNGDGEITIEEFTGTEYFFNRLDTNKDNKIQTSERIQYLDTVQQIGIKGVVQSELRPVFSTHDIDNDGYLSPHEFVNADVFIHDFNYFDEDGDNLISFEELKTVMDEELLAMDKTEN